MSFLKNIINTNGQIILNKFDGSSLPAYNQENGNTNNKNICFLDVETTGLDYEKDQIIELAIKLVAIDTSNGELIGVLDSYESFQDPSISIDEKVINVHGITNEMVKDQSINWKTVNQIFEISDIIVAHNAKFDRSFIDQCSEFSKEKVWSCSINDIDWSKRGFNSKGQELLCIWHGFYFNSHRAMSDVDALIHLLTHPSYKNEKPILELVKNATQYLYKICATSSPFETKDLLKERLYNWDNYNRVWWKYITEQDIELEKEWCKEFIYKGTFIGDIQLILPSDKYKV